MTDHAPLSGALARIARVAGEDAARKLARYKGDREVYLPSRIAGSELARLVGAEAAKAIVAEYGASSRIYIAGGEYHNGSSRRAKAARLLRKGLSVRAVSAEVELSVRAVQYIAADIVRDRDGRQSQLPFDID